MNEIIVVTDETTETEAEVIDEKIEDTNGEFEEEFSDAERQKYYEEMLDDEINDILKDYELYTYYCGKLWQKGSDKEVPVSTFLPIPVLDITYDNGSEQKRFFAIKGLKRVNGKIVTLPETKVKAEDCSSMNWITPSWGMSAFICPPMQSRKDALRGIMFDIGQRTAERKTIYSHTGWREVNGEWFYLHGGGAIGADGVEVDLEGKLGSYNMECRKQNFISCTNALADLFRVSKPEVMYPVMATVFLSPLNEFLRQSGCEPLFILFLLGKTQSRKSTLAALALSFFGKFTSSTLPSSFKDTANAMEKKGFILKDVLTVVDDLHPVSDSRSRKDMEYKMQALSRAYGDRTGRDRLNTDLTSNGGFIPRGNVLVTGEDFASIGQSGAARNFIIELMPNDIPVSEYLNKSQSYAADGYYITLMKAYIEWLIPQANFFPERLGSRFRHYREKARNNNLSGLGRTGDTVAWLMIGFDYLVSFLEYARTITSDQKTEMLSNAWEIFTKLALEQIDRSSEETPTQMFISAIHDLFETHRISTQLVTGFHDSSSDKVGYHDDKYYYFIPSKIYAEVENYYLQQGENFPLRKARIMSQLRAEGITVCDKNASTLQKRFFRGKSKYLCFPKVIIDGLRDDDKTVA